MSLLSVCVSVCVESVRVCGLTSLISGLSRSPTASTLTSTPPPCCRRRIVRHQIGDFGIALNMKSGQQSLQHIDLEGDPIYLPAELLSHEFPIGPAVDMFSLGATIFEVRDPGRGGVVVVGGGNRVCVFLLLC